MLIVLFIALLLLISAFFSLSETGITGASRSKIYKLKLEGDKRAEKVIQVLEKKDRLITTVLLGNNAVNTASSALATAFMIKIFGDGSEGIIYATVIMTLLILIFSEVLPKIYALKSSESVALTVAPIIDILVKIFYPITFIVEVIVNFLIRLFGLDKRSMDQIVHGLDAIRGAIELHHEEGTMVKEDKDMLGSIIELDNTEVQEIMQHRKDMETLDISMPVSELTKEVLKSQYSRIPVYDQNPDNIIGILHAKGLMRALSETPQNEQENLDIRSILKEPWFVPDSTTLKEQLVAFREKHQHFALVVDEYGTLLGIITLEDILEEIVGNINDEYDIDYNLIEEGDEPGSFIVDGTIPVRDLNREMDWDLPLDVATTLAGLIINTAQMIPAKAQTFSFYGFRFEILKKKRNQITKIKVKRLSQQ